MMAIIGLIVGGLLGALVGQRFETVVLGAFVGLVVGLVIGARRGASGAAAPKPAPPAAAGDARIAALERRLGDIEAALARAGLMPVPAQAAPAVAIPAAAAPLALRGAGATDEAPEEAERARMGETSSAAAAAGAAPERSAAAAGRSDIDAPPPAAQAEATPAYLAPAARKPNRIWAWITGGNTLARVGILVLFVGVGFLLKYAAEHVTVPIELRVAGVALGGIALLVVGWRLRERRTAYAMILQGGGVGVLYLTVFAALKLYALVPAPAALALLVAIAALSGVLAVRQDALALAVVAVLGGFLAPILTASRSGDHVLLFSYYALLNAGIFGIAWFKAWRLLNLLGFVCTFVVGTVWGVTRYRSDAFATTEPFLVLFFLFYVGIALLYALRRSVEVRHYVDGTLVFGTPLVAAGLQQALVRPFEFGMAFSALAASALYLALARILWTLRRDDLRLLTESFLALGVVFATLAVPLAFDARWTSATWALEGAAIVWIGVRQDRFVARCFGVALQLAAGVAFGLGGALWPDRAPSEALPILNSAFIGALLVAADGIVSAFVYARGAVGVRAFERTLTPVVFGWGVVWAALAAWNEIERFVPLAWQPAARVATATLGALAFAFAAQRLRWPLARIPALLLGPVLLIGAVAGVAPGIGPAHHLFGSGGGVAWPVAIAVVAFLLRRFERDRAYEAESPLLRGAHAVLLWLVAVVAAREASWLAAQYITTAGIWPSVPWGLAPALAVALAIAARGRWPVAAHPRAYLTLGAGPLAFWMLAWALVVGVGSDGNPTPLPYVPLFNPVDVTLGFIASTLVAWTRKLADDGIDLRAYVPREGLYGVPGALAFLWVNAVALRTLHHWFGIAWSLPALWHSTLVQSVLSLLWTVIALATMVVANRKSARTGWIAGAVLLGVVVAKLFVVDLSRVGGVERIVSFIGVGVLLLLIGYLAPVPPRKGEAR